MLLLLVFWTTAPFYPLWMAASGAAFASLMPLMLGRNVLPGLIMLGAFFGNHPGGRGLEFYDLALLSALLYRFPGLIHGLQSNHGSRYARLLILLLVSTVLSFVGAYYLLESFEGYKILPYHFLSARDWLPHYSIKVAAANIICATLVIDWALAVREDLSSTRIGAVLILMALFLPAIFGLLEFFPWVAKSLDRYHIWLDGYVDRTPPHRLFFLPPLFDQSPNSLFWNRSWFALYLISCLPAAGIALQFLPDRLRQIGGGKKTALLCGTAAFLGFLFLSIGARAGILSYGIFLIVLLVLLAAKGHRRALTWTILTGTILSIIAIPLLAYLPLGQDFLSERAELYRSGLQVFIQSPVLGSGVESFGFYNDLFLRAAGFQRIYSSTHNFLLQLLGGMGLAGLLVIGLFLFGAFRASVEAIVKAPAYESFAPILFFAGAIAFLIYGNFQELWYLRGIQLNWWFMVFGPIVWGGSVPAGVQDHKKRKSLNEEYPSLPELVFATRKRAVLSVFSTLLVLALSTFSFYRGLTLEDRWSLFENVGHLQRIPDSQNTGYALLRGDGSFLTRENGSMIQREFQCEENPGLSGPPDPRRICRYEPVDLENSAQEIPPGLR